MVSSKLRKHTRVMARTPSGLLRPQEAPSSESAEILSDSHLSRIQQKIPTRQILPRFQICMLLLLQLTQQLLYPSPLILLRIWAPARGKHLVLEFLLFSIYCIFPFCYGHSFPECFWYIELIEIDEEFMMITCFNQ